MSSPASLANEIYQSAKRGELQKVVKWLRSICREDTLQLVSPFHAPMASSERRHLLDSSWPE